MERFRTVIGPCKFPFGADAQNVWGYLHEAVAGEIYVLTTW